MPPQWRDLFVGECHGNARLSERLSAAPFRDSGALRVFPERSGRLRSFRLYRPEPARPDSGPASGSAADHVGVPLSGPEIPVQLPEPPARDALTARPRSVALSGRAG